MAQNGSRDRTVDFIITKASVDPETGERRWKAVVSEFLVDSQDDEVTEEFYEYAAHRIVDGVYPVPALVVSHFDDPRPEAKYTASPDVFIAGYTTDIYVDGDLPKAKGVFLDTPLGDAVFNAVRRDEQAGVLHDQRVRISMAFRPEPGGVEKSEVGHNIFHRGSIRHFAVTRVPIIKSTSIDVGELELKSDNDVKISKRQDAETIIGEELAGELYDAYSDIMKSKSDDYDLRFKAEDGEFDMGACVSVKVGEGKEEKQAVAICLNMARDAGAKVPPPPKNKSEASDEEYEDGEYINLDDMDVFDDYMDYLAENSDVDDDMEEKAGKAGNPYRDALGRFTSRARAATGRGKKRSREERRAERAANRAATKEARLRGTVTAEEAASIGSGGGFGGPSEADEPAASIAAAREAKAQEIQNKRDICINEQIGKGMSQEAAKSLCEASEKLRNRGFVEENELIMASETKPSGNFSDCIKVFVDKGFARAESRKICLGEAQKVVRVRVKSEVNGDLTEKINLSVPFDECVTVYVDEHGMSDEEARKICNSSKAKEARAGKEKAVHADDKDSKHDAKPLSECVRDRMKNGASRKEALNACMSNEVVKARVSAGFEKADLDSIVDLIISDDEVHVVTKAEQEELMTKVDEVTIEDELNALYEMLDELSDAKGDVEVVADEDGKGKSEVTDDDVNEQEIDEKSGSESESSEESDYDSIVQQLKSAMVDATLDRSEKVVLINHHLGEIGELAKQQISERTPASSSDVAGMLKSALDDTVSPLAMQVEMLLNRVNELELEKSQTQSDAGNRIPSSKQLAYSKSKTVEEVSEEQDTGGALTSRGIADKTVFYTQSGNPIY